jgi:hypothetical protein
MKKFLFVAMFVLLTVTAFAQTDIPPSEYWIHKYNIDSIESFFPTVLATTFIGNLTGNVTGNVTGAVTGNVVGPVTSNLMFGSAGTAYSRITSLTSFATNVNALSLTNVANTTRTTAATENDTSSFWFRFSNVGKPWLTVKGATGTTVLDLDTNGVLTGNLDLGTSYSKLDTFSVQLTLDTVLWSGSLATDFVLAQQNSSAVDTVDGIVAVPHADTVFVYRKANGKTNCPYKMIRFK